MIWFDISELLSWHGPLTGIQRVTSEIINRLLEKKIKLGLVRFDMVTQSFIEVDQADFLEITKLGSTNNYLEKQSATAFRFFVIEDKVKHFFKKIIPTDFHFRMTFIYRKFKFAFKSIYRFFAVPSSTQMKTPFSTGDTLICLGVTWGEDNFYPVLDKLKEKYHFKLASLVHDTIPLRFEGLFTKNFGQYFASHLKQTLKKSDILLHYSENTKRDLVEVCDKSNIPYPKFSRFNLGSNDVKQIAPRPVSDVNFDFCLMVSTIEVRKNHLLLIYVWEKLLAALGEKCPMLVLVGRPGWLADEALEKLKNNDPQKSKILWIPSCYDDQLFWLYQNCLFTLYPSMYEGWGLPVTESLAFGKLCIASNASAIPEAGGEFCEYHDPKSVDECFNLVLKYCTNKDLLHQKNTFIKNNYRSTNWMKSAESLLEAIDIHST